MRKLLTALGVMVSTALHAGDTEKWSVPTKEYRLEFPRDHGSHPDFRIEWWYLTGHLFSGERRFGFQATFFRLGQRPVDVEEEVPFGDSQIYMAHMAVSDPETKTFLHETRLNRGGWDARAEVGELDVRNGNWKLKSDNGAMLLSGSVRSEASLSLSLIPEQPPVVFGEDGISRKGPEGTAASYYITFPRLSASGELSIAGEKMQVEGEVWMDHEISSSQLDRNQVGWDWVSIQFFDGRELMGYVLREKDGKPSEWSRLVWIGETGELTHLTPDDYRWKYDGEWVSLKTGAVYPIKPTITAVDPDRGESVELRIRPIFQQQEISGGPGGVSYWEGACDVFDEAGNPIGRAYLELTGYADDIGERLR